MEKVIPIFYSEYGRYISRFRAIPLYVDCLKPVERRLLLVGHQIAKNDFVKSAQIIGTAMGNYHPHGDLSLSESLAQMVRGGYFSPHGGAWGTPGVTDSKYAHPRYTETKLEPWVESFAMEYIDYVPWEELELNAEPIYLPCPIPIGLIGDGVITGVSFYKTVLPKYKLSDLAKRLKFLLENNEVKTTSFSKNMKEKEFGPAISPNKTDCSVKELTKNEFYKLLMTGDGEIIYSPNGTIKKVNVQRGSKKVDIDLILIQGRAPNSSFNRIVSDIAAGTLDAYPLIDMYNSEEKHLEVGVEVKKRNNINLKKFAQDLWENYLVKKINFKCCVCDERGRVEVKSIDNILLTCYSLWKAAWHKKLNADIIKVNEKIYNNSICAEIKLVLDKNRGKINSVNDLISLFDFNKQIEVEIFKKSNWCKELKKITKEDVKQICSTSSIQKLLDHKDQKEKLNSDFNNIKTEITNIDKLGYSRISNFI